MRPFIKGWPHPITTNGSGSNQRYQAYAISTLKLLPSLQFLDTAKVSSSLADKRIENQYMCQII
jgi:hypothetical protein